jgi:hypothetical protein
MPRQSSANEYSLIVSHGPRAEYVPAALIAELKAIASIAASGNYTTALYSADGYYDLVVALTSSQAGAINLLRYVDDAGTVLLDATAPTQALVAATPAALVEVDAKPYASFKVQITNTGASAATLSAIAALQSAH